MRLVSFRLALACAIAVPAIPAPVHAHGETARGGGAGAINTVGAIITPGLWTGGLRLEMRQFDQFTDAQLIGFAVAGEDVHQHSQEFSAFLTGSYSIDEQWSIHASLPANFFRNFREAEIGDDGMPHLVVDDFSGGLGDLVALARFRPWHDGPHHLAFLGGIKLPTGMTEETDNDGERLGAHNQPGSGSVDFQLGVAYSLAVDWFQLDADVIAHIRTEGATSFQAGNMLQADVALSASVWQFCFVAELNMLVSAHDVERDEILRNSGIATLYLSPGVIVRFTDEHSIMGTFSYPIWQDLPGIQNQEAFRVSVAYSLAIGTADEHAHAHRHADDPAHPHEHPHDHDLEHAHSHDDAPPPAEAISTRSGTRRRARSSTTAVRPILKRARRLSHRSTRPRASTRRSYGSFARAPVQNRTVPKAVSRCRSSRTSSKPATRRWSGMVLRIESFVVSNPSRSWIA